MTEQDIVQLRPQWKITGKTENSRCILALFIIKEIAESQVKIFEGLGWKDVKVERIPLPRMQ